MVIQSLETKLHKVQLLMLQRQSKILPTPMLAEVANAHAARRTKHWKNILARMLKKLTPTMRAYAIVVLIVSMNTAWMFSHLCYGLRIADVPNLEVQMFNNK